MPITVDGTPAVFNSGTNESFTSSAAWASPPVYTCAGANRYVLVGISKRVNSNDVTGVTYDSVTMADLGTATNGSTGCRIFGLVNPPLTVNAAILAAYGAAADSSVLGIISFNGVDQTGSNSVSTIRGGAATSATGTSSTPTQTVTSATGELVVDCIAVTALQTVSGVGSGQTQAWSDTDAGGQFRRGAGSYEAGASSVVMDWTISGSGAWASLAVSLIAAAGAAGLPPGLGPEVGMIDSNQAAMMR